MKLSEVAKSMVRLPNGRGVLWAPITRDGQRAGITRAVRRTVTHSRAARTTGSLPRQGPRDAQAKEAWLASRDAVKTARAKSRAIGVAPTTTQAQDMDAASRRARYAQSEQTVRANARERSARRAELGYRKQLQREYDNVKLGMHAKLMTVVTPAAVAGSAVYVDRKSKVAKVDDRTQVAVAGGAGGAALGYTVSGKGGFAAKKILAARRKRALTNDPAYRETYAREWNAFRRREGFRHLKDLKDNFARADVMTRYPKALKDSRAQRLLAWKNKPVPYVAAMAIPAAAGSAYAAHRYDRAKGGTVTKLSEVAKASRKKDDHLRRSAGTAVATGGGVLAATGYVTGGVPGKRVTHGSRHVMGTSSGKDVTRRFLQGGIFGARELSHDEIVADFARQARNPQSKVGSFKLGRLEGKLDEEAKVIRQLKVGRRAGNAALVTGLAGVAGGLHMRRKRQVKKADRKKRDSTVPGAMIGGGLVTAGVGQVVPMELYRQSRKWKAAEVKHTNAKYDLAPGLVERDRRWAERHGTDPLGAKDLGQARAGKVRPRPLDLETARRAGHLEGEARQARYFAEVYRKHGKVIRAARNPGLAVAGVGAAGLGLQHVRRRPREMPNVAKQDGVYPFLNANIREDVIGIPETRRNPISPMQMLASSNIVASGYNDLKSRNPLFRGRRTQRGWHKIAMGTQMIDAPVGYGVML